MERKRVDASTSTVTDLGEFTAVAAADSVDRQREQIRPGAFGPSIARWRRSGKRVPLHWNHQGDPASIIGSVDPGSMRETTEGSLSRADLT